MNRRTFLKATAATSFAMGIFPALGAEAKTYRTAIIGTGWWGMNILGEAMASGRSRVVGMCDVDERLLDPAWAKVKQLTGAEPKRYADFREMLEREKPEICIVATPDHWHPLQTIAAVKAGAHVYVEKPISHTIAEGAAMVRAARSTGAVVQVGTHRRVSPHNVSGREFLRSGKAGKIGMIRAFVHYGGSGPENPLPNTEPPKGLNWDMWCGPAPLRPFNGVTDLSNPWRGALHPRGFRNYLDYANGTLGDWGIHWVDQVLWIMDQKWPRRIFSTGGRPIKGKPVLNATHQTSDAPDHQVASFEFDGFTLAWEHRQFGGNSAEKGENVGCYFYGTEGTFHMGWQKGWSFHPADSRKPAIHEQPALHEPDQQNIKELWADFLDAIEKKRRPIADIEEIHYSTNVSLLGMLSYKLGRSLAWDGAKEQVIGDQEANRMLRREYRKGWDYPV
ncbi:MAG TPA: Gfo/Idh/MocA family oxidoreductase [Clostridia bacterium]|nr:Gfo/Idh/MocA family oxidoreductase [Clostridia bacterium]